MAGRASSATIQAMKFIMDAHMTPYKASKRAGISLTTMYRNKLYKMWLASGDTPELRKEMDQTVPKPRKPTKKQKFINKVE